MTDRIQEAQETVGIYDNIFNPYVFNEISESSRVLDVGCWTGNLGIELITNKNCIVDGMEINEEALKIASGKGYTETIQLNLDSIDSDILSGISAQYDYIVFADVLEHLADPHHVLRTIASSLAGKNTKIIISLPNALFIQQRIMFLLGNFDYSPDGGIMDVTHLRFFTRKTALAMVNECELEIAKHYGYALVRDRYAFLRPLAKSWPSLFALQFIIVANKAQ